MAGSFWKLPRARRPASRSARPRQRTERPILLGDGFRKKVGAVVFRGYETPREGAGTKVDAPRLQVRFKRPVLLVELDQQVGPFVVTISLLVHREHPVIVNEPQDLQGCPVLLGDLCSPEGMVPLPLLLVVRRRG